VFETKAGRERWAVKFAFAALTISAFALFVTVLQWRSSERAANVADQARRDAKEAAEKALGITEQARKDAITEAERQRIIAQTTLQQQRRDAAAALEAQTKRADQANTLANRSANAAEQTVKTAMQELELTDRPWVDAAISLNGPFTFNVNGANIQLKIEMRNTGHTPAVATQTRPLTTIGIRSGDAADHVDKLCEVAKQAVLKFPYFGIALFPNATFQEQMSVGIGKEDIEKHSRDSPGKIMLPSVIICIAYRPTFDSVFVYKTAYIYDLYKLDSANRPGAAFNIGEDVDVKHLLWQLHAVKAITAE
jgi:hypothetical protein